MSTRVIRVGWFAFEGFGRPYEGWKQHEDGRWQVAGRAFTRRGAERRALALPDVRSPESFTVSASVGR